MKLGGMFERKQRGLPLSLGLLASKWSRAGFGVSYKGQTQRVITARVATWLEIVKSRFATNVEARAIWPNLAEWGPGVLGVGEWGTSTCTAQSKKKKTRVVIGRGWSKRSDPPTPIQENNDNVKNDIGSGQIENLKNNAN